MAPVDEHTAPVREVITGVAEDGTCVAISFDRSAREELVRRWPPIGLISVDGPVSGPSERTLDIGRGPTGPEVLVDGELSPGGWDRVESELALFAAERLTELVAVHAAVIDVGWGAVVVPGRSGSGKTSLCVAARAAGLRVRSDEYALVEPATAHVIGWPRPMRVRTAGGPVRVDLGDDGQEGRAALEVVLVAQVEFDPSGPGLREVTPGEVAMGLLANTVAARRSPDRSLTAALGVAAAARGIAGTRGDAERAIRELVRLADRRGAT